MGPSTCSPSMNAELTPELTETGRSCRRRLRGRRRRGGGGRRRGGGIKSFSLSALLRASNSYQCNYESFHTGHCFYTKLDDCFMSSLCCHNHTTIHAIRPFIQVLQVNLVRFNVDE